MPFAAALSTLAATKDALAEVCDRAAADLNAKPDLALVFYSAHHLAEAEFLSRELHTRLHPGTLLGCVAESVVGNAREVEQAPALTLWLARWSRSIQQTPFHLGLERTADGPSLLGWPDTLFAARPVASVDPFVPPKAAVLLLGDPYSFPVDLFLARMNEDAPGLPVLGGMASGIRGPGQCRLVQDGKAPDHGAVGVLIEGEIGLRSIVSQGCRPIGRHLVITRAQQNVILEVGGMTPLDYLRELWPTLAPDEQDLVRSGLHLGRVLNEYQGEFQRGDFLIRNVMGFDQNTGAVVVTDHVRVGQTVQFQVRDSISADEDLHALLQLDLGAHEKRPAGALLFSCNGRGTRLFPEPDHDATAIRQEAGAIPLAGFFAQGELGPVGGQNFIHGYTASVALFEE